MSVGRFLQQAAAGAGDTGDDDFANVVLLLDGDGPSGDNNNTFTDSSTNGFTVTENGSVVQGSFSPYGDNWSNYFGGNTAFQKTSGVTTIGTGDFTVEFWFYPDNVSAGYRTFYDGRKTSPYGDGVGIFQNGTDIEVWGNGQIMDRTGVITNGQWTHLALVRNSGSLQLYINGSAAGSAVSLTANLSSDKRTFGENTVGSGYTVQGYVSNLRETHSAVYTSAFTPSTSPLSSIANTEILTLQSNRFIDNSSNAYEFSIIGAGTPKVTPFSPFKNDDARDITTDGGSGYFDGSSDLASSGSVNWSTYTNITLEAWVYPTSLSSSTVHAIMGTASGAVGYTMFYLYSDGRIGVGITGVNEITSASGVIKNNKWQHVVAVKSGSTTTLYVDGTSVASATTAVWSNNSAVLRVGRGATSERMYGYLTDVRVVLGTAIVPSTLPTSPLTAVTNTEFLLNFQDAGIYDRSGINNLDTIGNAQIDTAVKKYGTGSIEFDGSGDYLKILQNDGLELGSGDYTIECWVNISAAANVGGIFSKGLPSTLNTSTWSLEFNTTNNYVSWYVQAASISYIITGSQNIKTSNWIHIAVTRSGNDTKLFVNGVQDGSTYTGGYTIATGGDLYLGTGFYAPTTRTITGYIDDFRITKGIARYTSSFTPPDAALPKF